LPGGAIRMIKMPGVQSLQSLQVDLMSKLNKAHSTLAPLVENR
jgi:hypothetical protein